MKHLATLLLLVVFSTVASAQLLKEDFAYPAGAAIDTLGWTAHSGTGPAIVSDTSLTYTGYAGSGIGNALNVFGTGEDVNRGFPEQTANGSTVYLSLMVNVSEAANSLTGGYFLHLGNRVSPTLFTAFCARVFARVDGSGNVNFGFSNTSTATWGTTNFAKNTTYLLIMKYTINTAGNDTTKMWILSSGVPTDEAAAGTPEVTVDSQTGQDIVNALGIRQSSNIPDVIIDGIRVATTWTNSVGGVDAPVLWVSPNSISFGKVLIGSHVTDSITVGNAGYAALNITSATPSAAVYTVTPGSASIPAQDSMKFAVKYTPTTAQLDSENVAFVSNAASSPDTVIVQGTGKAPGFSVSPTSFNFGKVWKDTTVTDTLFVTNLSSTDNLVIDSVVSADTLFTVLPISADIGVSATDTFVVTFNADIKGLRSGPIVFFHDSPAVGDTVMVSANCITHEPGFLAKPDTLDFHGVLIGKSKVDTITVKNDGYDSLFISAVTSTNAAFAVTPTSARIDSMASTKFVVTFTPASAGIKSGGIAFASNVPEGHDTVVVVGSGSTVTSIADARIDANSDFIPDNLNDTLFVAGVVTTPNFQPPKTAVFIQDGTAGIEIFSYDSAWTRLAIGDSVFVVGKIAQYAGLTEIMPLKMDTVNLKILKHNATVPEARKITAAEFNANPEDYEGSLVEIDTLYHASGDWPAEGSYTSVYYKPKNSTDTVRVFIDNDTNVDGSPQPQDPVNFTGVFSQYAYSASLDDGYELIPRDTADFKHVVLGAVSDRLNGIPKDFYLSQNYPNPFNPSTAIEFGLPKQTQVRIEVFNVLGQRVALLVDGVMKAGNHKITFNAGRLASGVYFYVMMAGEKVFKHKMLMIK